jgi:hypothetical protein
MAREGVSQKPPKTPYHEANNITFEGAVGQSRLIEKDSYLKNHYNACNVQNRAYVRVK